MFYYFAYTVSHGYFHKTFLSKLCMNEYEVVKELVTFHNSEDIEFFLGDNEKIMSLGQSLKDTMSQIMKIYDKYDDITANIEMVEAELI